MSKHEKRQSVFEEPHLRKEHFEGDPSEQKVAKKLREDSRSELEKVQQGAFQEVALGRPSSENALSEYFSWRRQHFGMGAASLFFLVTCLAAGVLAFLVAIIYSFTMAGFGEGGVIGAVTIAPPVEEFAKILLPVWIIEQRPWLFRWGWEIPLVCISGGLGFAVIENLTYLNIYIDQPDQGIVIWRWMICTAMHVAGASISSIGVVRYWKLRFAPAGVGDAASPVHTIGPYLAIAILLHALYNFSALLIEHMIH